MITPENKKPFVELMRIFKGFFYEYARLRPNYYIISCGNMMNMYRRLSLIHHRKPSCKHS